MALSQQCRRRTTRDILPSMLPSPSPPPGSHRYRCQRHPGLLFESHLPRPACPHGCWGPFVAHAPTGAYDGVQWNPDASEAYVPERQRQPRAPEPERPPQRPANSAALAAALTALNEDERLGRARQQGCRDGSCGAVPTLEERGAADPRWRPRKHADKPHPAPRCHGERRRARRRRQLSARLAALKQSKKWPLLI
jgi:hypothetical protein